jgi:hypothetical protein
MEPSLDRVHVETELLAHLAAAAVIEVEQRHRVALPLG